MQQLVNLIRQSKQDSAMSNDWVIGKLDDGIKETEKSIRRLEEKLAKDPNNPRLPTFLKEYNEHLQTLRGLKQEMLEI